MQRHYLKSSIKVARLARLIAKLIDLGFAFTLAFFFYPLGVIAAIAYMVMSDSLQNGQSFGKKIMGFAVISLEDGKPCTIKQSTIRNLPFIIPLGLGIIPFWGWVIGFALGAVLVSFETYLLYKIDSGHRLGDVMADTSVMANDGTPEAIKKRKDSWFTPPSSQGLS